MPQGCFLALFAWAQGKGLAEARSGSGARKEQMRAGQVLFWTLNGLVSGPVYPGLKAQREPFTPKRSG